MNFLQELDTSDISEVSKQAEETEENDDFDQAGNELISLISAKFKLASPKLIISNSSSQNHSGMENASLVDSPTKANRDMDLQNSISSTPKHYQSPTLITTILNNFTNKFEEIMANQQAFQQQQQEKMLDYQQKLQEQVIQLQQQQQKHIQDLQLLKGPTIVYEEIDYQSTKKQNSL